MCVKIGYFFALKSVKNRLLIYFLNTLVNLFPKQEEVDNDPIGAGANENEVTSLLNSNRYGRTDFICRVRFAPKKKVRSLNKSTDGQNGPDRNRWMCIHSFLGMLMRSNLCSPVRQSEAKINTSRSV